MPKEMTPGPPTPIEGEGDEELGAFQRVMLWTLEVDRESTQAYVEKFRTRHPDESPGQLADRLIRRAKWWAVAWGFATGVPANPWVAVPAALTDTGAVLRVEVNLAVRIALLYDPHFLDDDEPPFEVLVPIFGLRASSEFLREISVRGTMGLTRAAIRSQLNKQTLAAFKRIMAKYLGLRVTQRGVIKGTLPVVGGVVGGGWNYRELSAVGTRVKRYFEEQRLGADGAGGTWKREGEPLPTR